MSNLRHIKYPSIDRFDKLYDSFLSTAKYQHSRVYGEDITHPKLPIIHFTGSEKIHGENMAVCYTESVGFWIQGRNHIRTLMHDQNGMASFVRSNESIWLNIVSQLVTKFSLDVENNTLVLDCEWAGENIQKGNSACSGTPKAAYLFDFARVVSNEDDSTRYISTKGVGAPRHSIFNIAQFSTYSITLDFNEPILCEKRLKVLIDKVEKSSPIALWFGKDSNVGEGIVLSAFHCGKLVQLKAKGDAHGGKPRTKTGKVLSPETQQAIIDVTDKVTPTWRITQGIEETNATTKQDIGKLLKWVNQDILKEDLHIITNSNLEFKDISRSVAKVIKEYYFDHIKSY
jgi:hypothetical protein